MLELMALIRSNEKSWGVAAARPPQMVVGRLSMELRKLSRGHHLIRTLTTSSSG
jgi:hypothetical protein